MSASDLIGWATEAMNSEKLPGLSFNDRGETPDMLLPAQAHEKIGVFLRLTYGSVLAEPLPERFRQLLIDLGKGELSK